MVHDSWFIKVHGLWFMVYGSWIMVYSLYFVSYGLTRARTFVVGGGLVICHLLGYDFRDQVALGVHSRPLHLKYWEVQLST